MPSVEKTNLQAQLKVLIDKKATGAKLTPDEEAKIVSLMKQIADLD